MRERRASRRRRRSEQSRHFLRSCPRSGLGLSWELPVRAWMRRLVETQRRKAAKAQVLADGHERENVEPFLLVLRCGTAFICGILLRQKHYGGREDGGKAASRRS